VTLLQTDNSTSNDIINGTVKQQQAKAIDMRFNWVRDHSNQGHFKVSTGC
jgi:phage terminase large subunit-like protein